MDRLGSNSVRRTRQLHVGLSRQAVLEFDAEWCDLVCDVCTADDFSRARARGGLEFAAHPRLSNFSHDRILAAHHQYGRGSVYVPPFVESKEWTRECALAIGWTSRRALARKHLGRARGCFFAHHLGVARLEYG